MYESVVLIEFLNYVYKWIRTLLKAVHVGFVLATLALGQVSPQILEFFPVSNQPLHQCTTFIFICLPLTLCSPDTS